MAYPQTETKNFIIRGFDYLKNRWTGQEPAKGELIIPNHESMQSEALKLYLDRCKSVLLELKVSNIPEVCREMLHIFYKLNNCWIWSDGRPMPQFWKCEQLIEVSRISECMAL